MTYFSSNLTTENSLSQSPHILSVQIFNKKLNFHKKTAHLPIYFHIKKEVSVYRTTGKYFLTWGKIG